MSPAMSRRPNPANSPSQIAGELEDPKRLIQSDITVTDDMNNSNDNDQDTDMQDSNATNEDDSGSEFNVKVAVKVPRATKSRRKRVLSTEEYQAKIKRKNQKGRDLMASKTKLQRKIAELKRTNIKLQARNKEMDQNIQNLCAERTSQIKGQTFVEDDGRIASAMASMFSQTKAWSKSYGFRKSKDVNKNYAHEVQEILCNTAEIPNIASRRAIHAAEEKIIPPYIILNGILNGFVVTQIFQLPMGYLNQPKFSPSLNLDMTLLKSLAHQFDQNNAYRTLASIVRAIDPPEGSSATIKPKTWAARIPFLKANHADNLSIHFIDKFDSLLESLNDDKSPKRQQDLKAILLDAVKFASRVAAQNPVLIFNFRQAFTKFRFHLCHDRMQAHPALKLDVDDLTHETKVKLAQYRHSPDLVVEPEVLIIGDREGQDYSASTRRSIGKALVYMVPKED